MPSAANQPLSTITLPDFLIQAGALSAARLQELKATAASSGRPLMDVIEQMAGIREEELVKLKGQYYNKPQVELFGRIVRADVLNIVPEELAKNYRIVAFEREDKTVSIAMVDPTNYKAVEAIDFIAREHHFKIKIFITSAAALDYILKQYASISQEVEEALQAAELEAKPDTSDVTEVEEGFENIAKRAPVTRLVSVILQHAVDGHASDVHVEPVGKETRIRYRVDGILHTTLQIQRDIHSSIVSRIKVLSNLKTDETRVPQDGRFRLKFEKGDVDFRISTLPLINSEKVVMRILDTASAMYNLEDLGFEGNNLESMRQGIAKSHGMFLITGPTGSGKSTTLYALMSIMNKEGVNIVTLEDPVEYYMKGVNQSQVNPEVGLTFAAGLRSILRQDPDVIMVGEIRDRETAELAVHAALTGHIVLSTLHTNDAFGAVPRMIDMGIEPFLLASSVNLVMAQRLVRRICQYCKIDKKLDPAAADEVKREIGSLPKESWPKDFKPDSALNFSVGRGCARCENSGYKGRVAIGEVVLVTENMKKIVGSKGNMIDMMKEEFAKAGNVSMKQDGIFKAMRGLTTIEEVFDATRS